jgi:hypothetical protein
VQPLGEAPEADAASGQLLDDGEDLLCVASEAVELPHREDVALSEVVQSGIELRAARR